MIYKEFELGMNVFELPLLSTYRNALESKVDQQLGGIAHLC